MKAQLFRSLNFSDNRTRIFCRADLYGRGGQYLFGLAEVGDRGQIVLPQKARTVFDLQAGDRVLIVGDQKKGIAMFKIGGVHDLLFHKDAE